MRELSNRIAWTLIERGVGPETIVAVEMPRSLETIATILAIHKAGGAYMPLDGPPRRNERILEIARPKLHLTGTPPLHARDDDPPVRHGPDNLAYVLFTSGSTGTPKGAMIEHRSLDNHLASKIEDFQLGPDQTVAQTASLGFDISVWQMLAPIRAGANVRIISAEEQRDPYRFYEALREVSVLELIPAHFNALLSVPGELPNLRYAIPTGEPLPAELARRWLERFPHTTMVNAYGPTECCDDVLLHFFREPCDPVPLGRPVRNVQVYLLDENLEETQEGEICVGGVQVGRGYLNDPERTAQSFLEHPRYGRIYRTGDLARRHNGELYFLGRRDFQLKLRGVRIELEEIEAALHRSPGIMEAAAAVHGQRLIAYVAPQDADVRDVKATLLQELPEPCQPNAYVRVERLPRTPNGKLDRGGLPAPRRDERPPRDTLELTLTRLFEEVLEVQPVGIEESFFELGGSSLSALDLLARIQRELEIPLSAAHLLEAPSVAELALKMRHHARMPLGIKLKDGSGPPRILLPGAGGNLFYLYDLVQRLPGPVYGFLARGLDGKAPPFTSIEEAAETYLQELPHPEPHLVGHSIGGWVAYEMALRHPVASLTILDMPAPPGPPPEPLAWVRALGELFAQFYERSIPRELHTFDQVQGWLKSQGLLPQSVSLQPILNVYRANHEIVYRPERACPGKIKLVRTLAGGFSIHAPLWGWERFSTQPIEVHILPGNHLSVLRPPLVDQLCRRL